ncbi:MAG: alpha-2-macroglobulin, partial [Spirochaetales bacterium]|nr:alpha-2-macroglobulin [Spirochaetales bacterium]
VLNAVAKVIKTNKSENVKMSAKVLLDDKKIAAGDFKDGNFEAVNVVINENQLSDFEKDKLLPLQIIKDGKGSLYYSASLTYSLPEEMQISRDEGIGVFANIYDDVSGEEIVEKDSVVQLKTDKVYRMEVNVLSSYDRNYLALRLPIPSGAEIVDVDFGKDSNELRFANKEELFDNEAHVFWSDFVKGRAVVSLRFRTVRRGVFPTPSINAECIYEPEVFGRTGGVIFTIE